jgi:hypothetical protein
LRCAPAGLRFGIRVAPAEVMESLNRRVSLLLVACCVLAGCQNADVEEGSGESAPVATASDTVFSPQGERVALPRSKIYYTLTTHEWYARGEPLMHEGRAYRPGGMPISVSLDEMTQVGEFQGVEYYARQGENMAALYVPVFEGYWQTFRTDATVVDTTTSTAPPAAQDTTSAS